MDGILRPVHKILANNVIRSKQKINNRTDAMHKGIINRAVGSVVGRGPMVHLPDFGRPVNPISTTGGGTFCPPHFRPSYGPDKYSIIVCVSIHFNIHISRW